MTERLRVVLTALLFLAAAVSTASGTDPIRLETGDGRFVFRDPPQFTGKNVPVWYFKPEAYTPDTPIVFVMHGASRNADGYRDAWRYLAAHHNLLVLAPEFSKDDFPKSWTYNLGNLARPFKAGNPVHFRPRKDWTYPIIDRIFERVRTEISTRQTRFALYGHSAGGQFVPRYMTFTGGAKVAFAITANAGWYTLPDYNVPFPYGLAGTDLPQSHLAQAFAKNLVVLLGENDTKQGRYLRRTPEAMEQGSNRLARGKLYFETTRRKAGAMGTPFAWRLVFVPDVGHSNAGIAPMAAKLVREAFKTRR